MVSSSHLYWQKGVFWSFFIHYIIVHGKPSSYMVALSRDNTKLTFSKSSCITGKEGWRLLPWHWGGKKEEIMLFYFLTKTKLYTYIYTHIFKQWSKPWFPTESHLSMHFLWKERRNCLFCRLGAIQGVGGGEDGGNDDNWKEKNKSVLPPFMTYSWDVNFAFKFDILMISILYMQI